MLLATERSEHDAGSERIALAMASRCGLPLAGVLPLLSNPEYEAVAPQLAARAEAAAATRLAGLAAEAAAAGVDWRPVVRRGPALFREIVDEAIECQADLIVIRRRGRLGRLANLLVGEMVGQVLAQAPCSVLVVPRESAMWSRHVMVAVDPTAPDAAALLQGSAVAAECAMPLTLVAVTDGADETRARQALDEALVQVHRRVPQARALCLRGRAHAVLTDTAARLGADLVVVGRHGDGGFARAWVGGVAQKVIGLSACPVLVAIAPAPVSPSMPSGTSS
ncbi:universal stress protein [Ideonella sp. A 288]|uniref:universal stress protein n=1 Tax=Ideonella sp. A 288 TaxID=1962181 RepID=UPI000B4AD7CB|nr:universal stress protein [Ideonella sp. A 288]